ncbi:MAG: hypothetical protein HY326_08020 [Chloroflexi bacterium]|nr:hypothetical protein [Chloroflexota bacterium]
MPDLLILLRANLLGWSNRLRRKGTRGRSAAFAGLILTPLSMLAVYGLTRLMLAFVRLRLPDQPWAITFELMAVATTTAFFVLVTNSVRQAFETFYLGTDLPILLASPLSRRTIFRFKFITNVVRDATVALVLAVPAWLAFGQAFQAPGSFYLTMLLGWFFLLILISGFGVLLAMAIVRAIPAPRARQFLLSFSLLIPLGGVGAIQAFLSGVLTPDEIFTALAGSHLQQATLLPPVWLAQMLATQVPGFAFAGSFANPFMLLTGASLFFLGLSVILAEQLYASGWSLVQGQPLAPRHRTGWHWFKLKPSPVRAILLKDLRTFLRQPAQWYYLASGALLLVFTAMGATTTDRGVLVKGTVAVMMAYVAASTFGMVLSLYSLSRESHNWWIIQASPLDAREIYRAKWLYALIPTAVLSLIGMTFIQILGGIEISQILASALLLTLLNITMVSINVAMGTWRADFTRPPETQGGDPLTVIVAQSVNYGYGLFPILVIFLVRASPIWPQMLHTGGVSGLILAVTVAYMLISIPLILISHRLGVSILARLRVGI